MGWDYGTYAGKVHTAFSWGNSRKRYQYDEKGVDERYY
jgi:hypothetical protein